MRILDSEPLSIDLKHHLTLDVFKRFVVKVTALPLLKLKSAKYKPQQRLKNAY